ncbi:MAG: ABC transporter permease subunit [Ruminococcus sp.]|nr:ABC transporter permease subunit [Ruminococcus sp.]
MERLKRLYSPVQILFILSILIQFLPNHTKKPGNLLYAVGLLAVLEVIQILIAFLLPAGRDYKTINGIFGVIFSAVGIWTLLTAKLAWIPQDIFKAPDVVTEQFVSDLPRLITDLGASLTTITAGYLLALATAIPTGLFLGWNAQVGKVSEHIANFLGSIPPIVFVPYALALLPTFKSCSVFVIFITAFFPILSGTMSGVQNISPEILSSAKVLCVPKISMLFQILLPASLPQIFDGCNMGLLLSFILLTSAEMIGGNSGIGFYIQYYTNFGNFTRIMVGIVFLGTVVTLITNLVKMLEAHLLRWKK